VQHRAGNWTAVLVFSTVVLVSAAVSAAERYDLILTDAAYSSVTQEKLRYSSFVGDRQTGAIYSCTGDVQLEPKTGDLKSHKEACTNAYVSPAVQGDYTFSRLSVPEVKTSTDKPKMDPSWGFWRIDQAKHLHAFCLRYGASKVVWTCFETPLP
jgi:hypothetical protein